MKKIFLSIIALVMVLPLTATANTKLVFVGGKRPSIRTVRGLRFSPHMAGGALDVVVDPSASNAAVFRVQGKKNRRFKLCIVGDAIRLKRIRGGGPEIIVNHFRYGGDLSPGGIGRFSGRGTCINARLGGTAHVAHDTMPGRYRSRGTIRIIYI